MSGGADWRNASIIRGDQTFITNNLRPSCVFSIGCA